MEVLVFKTSVQSLANVNQLTPGLNQLAGSNQWNFALDDSDCILRILSSVSPDEAIQVLADSGFYCEELK